MSAEEKFDLVLAPLADFIMTQEMYEALQSVERWAFGEGIELSPSVKKRLNAIRSKINKASAKAAF